MTWLQLVLGVLKLEEYGLLVNMTRSEPVDNTSNAFFSLHKVFNKRLEYFSIKDLPMQKAQPLHKETHPSLHTISTFSIKDIIK